MARLWSALFLMVPVLGTGFIVCAALGCWPLEGHWLPENVNRDGVVIDRLFRIILYLTGAIFIGTGLVLSWLCWRYSMRKGETAGPRETMIRGSRKLELVWTLIPGGILVFLSIYQMDAWQTHKMHRPTEVVDGKTIPMRPLARVIGKQFGWEVQYAGADQTLDTGDDYFVENLLHVPYGRDVVLQLESNDVIHSFFVPSLRLKQDMVPGMIQFCWFHAVKAGEFEIACAELCGWGHYKMKGQLVIESPQQFDLWLAEQVRLQNMSRLSPDSSSQRP